MELTENDAVIISTAPLGSLVYLDNGQVVKVLDRTDDQAWFVIMECEMFLNCDRMATTIKDHVILGHVPACHRCSELLA